MIGDVNPRQCRGLTCTTRRDPTCTITNAYSVWKNSVTTGTKSQAQVSWPCVFKKVDQVCPDGGRERTARMYFWIVRFATRTPNFSNSPRIPSAPQRNIACQALDQRDCLGAQPIGRFVLARHLPRAAGAGFEPPKQAKALAALAQRAHLPRTQVPGSAGASAEAYPAG